MQGKAFSGEPPSAGDGFRDNIALFRKPLAKVSLRSWDCFSTYASCQPVVAQPRLPACLAWIEVLAEAMCTSRLGL